MEAASLVVIRGQRRVGKSCLAEEFGKEFPKSYTLVGLPPEQQRAEFARQLRRQGINRNLSK